jgi:hypothetical protein
VGLSRTSCATCRCWSRLPTVVSPGGFDRRIVICLDLCEVRELADVGDEGRGEERRELLDQLRRKRLTRIVGRKDCGSRVRPHRGVSGVGAGFSPDHTDHSHCCWHRGERARHHSRSQDAHTIRTSGSSRSWRFNRSSRLACDTRLMAVSTPPSGPAGPPTPQAHPTSARRSNRAP